MNGIGRDSAILGTQTQSTLRVSAKRFFLAVSILKQILPWDLCPCIYRLLNAQDISSA